MSEYSLSVACMYGEHEQCQSHSCKCKCHKIDLSPYQKIMDDINANSSGRV